MSTDTLTLAKQLINIRSITPDDNGCQTILIDRLQAMGFQTTEINQNGVRNFWAQRGTQSPLFVFSGHTDVVPPGPEEDWHTPPFTATERDGYLYGRGAADMKSALAAMIVSCERFLKKYPEYDGSIGFIITSDEEGVATDGTVRVVEYLQANNITMDWCIVGEASSNQRVGDAIKVGRRGSLHGQLEVIGKQGHIAYPQDADNPIHRCFKALDALAQTQWDEGNAHFNPTSFQIYNIEADTGATNIIPGTLTAKFNFRFSPASTAETLQERVHKAFDDHQLNYKVHWNLSSHPFLSHDGPLTKATKAAIKTICQIDTHANTTGGTSDGRFIAPTGTEVIELGPSSKSIHQVNENTSIADLMILTDLYEKNHGKTINQLIIKYFLSLDLLDSLIFP